MAFIPLSWEVLKAESVPYIQLVNAGYSREISFWAMYSKGGSFHFAPKIIATFVFQRGAVVRYLQLFTWTQIITLLRPF